MKATAWVLNVVKSPIIVELKNPEIGDALTLEFYDSRIVAVMNVFSNKKATR